MSRPVALRDLGHRLGEGQQPRASQLVHLADVTFVGECCHRDVGDVVSVDERFRGVTGGQSDLAAEHVVEHVVLAEVLCEPGGAHDGERRAGIARGLLRELGLGLAAAGEEHEPRHAGGNRQASERADRVDGAGDRDVRVVRDVHRADAFQRGRPRVSVFPIERRSTRPRADPDGQVERPESLRDPSSRLAGPAEHQGGLRLLCRSHEASRRRSAETVHRRKARIHTYTSTMAPWTPSPRSSTVPGRGARSRSA